MIAIIALVISGISLALSIAVVVRQWRREEQADAELRTAWVQVRLIDRDGQPWWKIENHGPDWARLWSLQAMPAPSHEEESFPEGDPTGPMDPPMYDPRLLPTVLPAGSHAFLPAELGDTDPPYLVRVWYSDRRDKKHFRKKKGAKSYMVVPEPPG